MHFLLLLFLSVVVSNSKGSVLEVSPCPRIFTYEGETNHPDRWYGILTLLSDTELNGVWIRVIFDKPIIQLGVSACNLSINNFLTVCHTELVWRSS